MHEHRATATAALPSACFAQPAPGLAAGRAEAATGAALSRIATLNPSLNAVIAGDPTAKEQAEQEAEEEDGSTKSEARSTKQIPSTNEENRAQPIISDI